IVELDFRGRELSTFTWEDKYHKRADQPGKICPARLDDSTAGRLRDIATATFHACCCRDYARIDFRIDRQGNPFVLQINSMASLGEGASFVLAAKQAGYSFDSLVHRIVDVAHQRYFNQPAPAWQQSQSQQFELAPSEALDGQPKLELPDEQLRFA